MAVATEDTLAGQIKALRVGLSISRTKRLDLTDKDRDTSGDALAKLRNQVNQAVGRIRKEKPGSNFRVESAVAVTDDKRALLATVAVTRMPAGDTQEESDEETDI